MEIPRITDGELNVANVLWEKGSLPATEIVKVLNAEIGWNRNTTYTFINRLVQKGIIRRDEPGFVCTVLYTREQIGSSETKSFVNKMFGGSLRSMVASFLDSNVSKRELDEVRDIISRWEKEKTEESEIGEEQSGKAGKSENGVGGGHRVE